MKHIPALVLLLNTIALIAFGCVLLIENGRTLDTLRALCVKGLT